MRRQLLLFGLYLPGRSWLHRAPVAAKYALVAALSLPALLTQRWETALVLLAVSAGLLLTTGLRPRLTLSLLPSLLAVAAGLLTYHAVFTSWRIGVALAANLVGCVYAARLLTLTSPASDLVDALVSAARPLRIVGVNPERVGLAVALMLRSIPYLIGAFDEVRTAARARGLERHLAARITPVVVSAVAYAEATGEALAARGLGDDDSGS